MTDPLYSDDFLLDMGIAVKEEMPMDTSTPCMTASVPIPARRLVCGVGNYNAFEYVEMPSTPVSQGSGRDVPLGNQDPSDLYNSLGGMTMWGARALEEREPTKSDLFPMDDDEFFQLDKSDLIQGSSLVEISVCDNFLDGISFDDIMLPEENSVCTNVQVSGIQTQSVNFPVVQVTGSGTPSSSGGFAPLYPGVASPVSHHSSSSSLPHHSAASSATPPPSGASPLHYRHSTLHELLLRKETLLPDRQLLGQSMPGRASRPSRESPVAAGAVSVSRLSSSAPTHLGFEQIWQRREPRPHLLSTSSLAEAESTSSLSTGGVLSPESHDLSHDEHLDSDDNSDHYEDFSSDGESSDGEGLSSLKTSPSKKERYFWQYNVQAKGPKGMRLVLKTQLEDPHVLNEVTDPVFSPECSVQGIKHSGKARKGDGNDLTPNPRKLCSIGRELDKLARMIDDITPVSELPFTARPKTRKEKNKLASRACRLKKKAQHEANKIKLYGLEQEHRRLNMGIAQLKQLLAAKFSAEDSEAQEELTRHMDRVVKAATKLKIAGSTTDFVNRILDKVKTGIPGGGLDEI